MPEGPEVETVRRTLHPMVEGRRLGAAWVSDFALRRPVKAADFSNLVGKKVVETGRHGKLLWLEAEDKRGLWVRLGMTGRLLVQNAKEERHPHTHVVIPLDDGREELRYVDVRRFGEVVPYGAPSLLEAECARMGPDPLTWGDEERLQVAAKLKRTQRSLKEALLDQSLIAGVGNIYASEALFEARISPYKKGHRASKPALLRLLEATESVLRKAVKHRGTTFSDFVDSTGGEGQNLQHVAVFWRAGEPCPNCTRPIEKAVQGGRSTYFCRKCQR